MHFSKAEYSWNVKFEARLTSSLVSKSVYSNLREEVDSEGWKVYTEIEDATLTKRKCSNRE